MHVGVFPRHVLGEISQTTLPNDSSQGVGDGTSHEADHLGLVREYMRARMLVAPVRETLSQTQEPAPPVGRLILRLGIGSNE